MLMPRPDPRGGFHFSFSPKQFGLRWTIFSKIPKLTKIQTKEETHIGELFAMAYRRRVQNFMVSIAKTACGHSQGNTFGGLLRESACRVYASVGPLIRGISTGIYRMNIIQ